jgi:hypothetical protein
MIITAIYLLSIILFSSGIDILKVSSVLFCLAYLPGLLIFINLKNGHLTFQDVALAFPVSIGVTSILTLGLLYSGIHAGKVFYILYVFEGAVILYYLLSTRGRRFRIKLSHEETIFIIIFLILIALLSIPVFSERVAITVHGFHHASIVAQILNGIFPPENPGMGGTRLSYQWGYHSLIAVISSPADLQPLRVFSIINLLSLFFIFCITYQIARDFNFSEGYGYLLPLAVIGLMRMDAGILFVYNLLSGGLTTPINPGSTPSDIYLTWASGASYLDSRLFFLSKFYNANSMPLGICLVFAYFVIILILSKKNHKSKKVYLTILSFILIGIAINYTIFLMIPISHMTLWVLFILLSEKGDRKKKIKEAGELLLPSIVAAIIVLPYLIYISGGGTINIGRTSTDPFILSMYKIQKIKNLMAFWLSLPLIIVGIWVALKRYLGFSQRMFFILSGALVCLLLADLLRLPWYDSYKFIFILSLFFALLFIFSLRGFLSLIAKQWLKGFIIVCVIFFLLLTPVMTETAYIISPWFKDNTYTFSGRHIIFNKDYQRNEAYMWLRDKTTEDSLILLPYLSVSYPYWDIVAHNYTYRVAAITERAYFVIRDVYAWTTPGYKVRVKMRDYIFKNPSNPALLEYLKFLDRDIYILLEDGYKDKYLKDVIFDELPHNNDKIFNLVFNNNKQKIYRLNLK